MKTGRPKMHTYYQLVLRPQLDVRSRDAKELSLLAKCLDLLSEGRLPQLADALAARLIAVDVATRQGWSTARHLELWGEEEGPAPPHIVLSAQKHARQIEKAGGKGSWPQRGNWSWPSAAEASGKSKGKGKGKSKSGKNPYKGGKQSWGKGDQKTSEASGHKAEAAT